jgi:prepilin-type N-terminal cleavage/methylation domain-containing protein
MQSQGCFGLHLSVRSDLSPAARGFSSDGVSTITNSLIRGDATGTSYRRILRSRNMPRTKRGFAARGFTAVELLITLAVGLTLASFAVPLLQNAMNFLKVRAAATSISGAIESTRFQAIFHGCPYAVTFDNAAMTYQVSAQLPGPAGCAAAFTNVGAAGPIANGSSVTLNQNVTFQFRPGGLTQTTAGVPTLVLDCHGSKETITVSTYGNITVKP